MNYNKLLIINRQLSIIQLFSYSVILLTALLFSLPLKAQVNIGDKTSPQPFSLLEINSTYYKGGLRLPQLTTAERDSLTSAPAFDPNASLGLVIYNTDNNCVEYWNIDHWTTLCNDNINIVFTKPNNSPRVKANIVDPTATPFPAAGDSIGPFAPHDNPECTGINPVYTVSIKIGAAYTRVKTVDATTGAFTMVMDPNLSSGLRYAVVSVTDNCIKESQDFIFSQASCVLPAQPGAISGPASICTTGGAPGYSISAVAGATSYAWTVPSSWTIASGQGTVAISVTPVSTVTSGNISVTAINSCGVSPARTIAVSLIPVFTQPNPANVTICYNTTTTFSLGATTGGSGAITYLWQQSSDSINWVSATGTNNTQNYTTPSLMTKMYYRRQATAATCGGTLTSAVATVTVYANFTQPNPTAVSICYNSTNAFTLAAATGGNGAITYQWQSSTNNSTWTNISGATSANYTTSALTANTYYRRQATSATCGTISSTGALVTVYTNFTQPDPTAATICPGSTNTFTLAAATGGSGAITYQWQSSTNNSTWTNISGATAVNYTTSALTANTYYRRQATSATCGTIPSASALVSVKPNLSTPAITLSQTCIYNSGAVMTASVPAVSGATYSWTLPAGLTAQGSTTSYSVSFTATTAGTSYTVKVTETGCNTVTATSATITVYQEPNSLANARALATAHLPVSTHGLWVEWKDIWGNIWYDVLVSASAFPAVNGIICNSANDPQYSYNGSAATFNTGTTYMLRGTSGGGYNTCASPTTYTYSGTNVGLTSGYKCGAFFGSYVASGSW